MENKKTPAILQYEAIQETHPNTVILMKMGDFYESFGDNAKILNTVLGLTLTTRSGVKMAGLPYHSIAPYIKKLLQAGHKVALAEPTNKSPDGAVQRGVVRIINNEIIPFNL